MGKGGGKEGGGDGVRLLLIFFFFYNLRLFLFIPPLVYLVWFGLPKPASIYLFKLFSFFVPKMDKTVPRGIFKARPKKKKKGGEDLSTLSFPPSSSSSLVSSSLDYRIPVGFTDLVGFFPPDHHVFPPPPLLPPFLPSFFPHLLPRGSTSQPQPPLVFL